jgi:fluoride exporter
VSPVVLAVVASLCGGTGAVARYVIDAAVQRRVRRPTPFGTITVNVVGSFVLGVITGVVVHHHLSADIERIVGVGFCGGLTTFSTASFETVRLFRERLPTAALNAAVGGVTLSCLAGAIGLAVALV